MKGRKVKRPSLDPMPVEAVVTLGKGSPPPGMVERVLGWRKPAAVGGNTWQLRFTWAEVQNLEKRGYCTIREGGLTIRAEMP